LNPIKKLASQTVVYGIPSIAGRFLNYLLTYLYTRVFALDQFGVNSELYAYSGFFTVLLLFGMDTAFFRFQQKEKDPARVYSTVLNFIIPSSLTFLLLLYVFGQPVANLLKYPDHINYIHWFGWMLMLDSIAAIPFVKLRAQNKAFKFAGIKTIEIAVNITLNIFFLVFCRSAYLADPNSFLGHLYNPTLGIGYVFVINLVASAVKIILLLPEFKDIVKGFDRELFNRMIRYSMPMVIIGFAGIINEMLDRMILHSRLPYDNDTNLKLLGIYGACYKLSLLMSLFIQAFRFAAEPFFFAHADKTDSKKLYADVMNYFVIFCVFVFLLVMLYLHWFQYFIGKPYRVGLPVVPILLMANLCFGLYVNLSIWYKLTDRTLLGAVVSFGGAALTVVLNVIFIPNPSPLYGGYMASAWATLACYGSMAIASYFLGQKYFPVKYYLKKDLGYIVLGLVLWQLFEFLKVPMSGFGHIWILSTVLMLVFLGVVWVLDGRKVLERGFEG
jgi:O-antigen/teichoic acid export membrane protein